jgi:ATP-dependent DNA ligase
MTRNRQRVTGTYPEIAGALRAQDATGFVIDGEVVAFDGNTLTGPAPQACA